VRRIKITLVNSFAPGRPNARATITRGGEAVWQHRDAIQKKGETNPIIYHRAVHNADNR
jgi:hypothetical protein